MADRDDVVVVERRPKRHVLRTLLGLAVLAVIVVVIIVAVLATKESDDAKDDVSVSSCTPASGDGKPTASGQIDNTSSKDSNYTIRLDFVDADGNTVSNGAATVNDVGAGEQAQWQLTGARDASGEVQCEITGVSRTHLPGQ
jgi:hypothetical protein